MKNDKTVSKLADAQTELTVLSSQPEHIQVQLQISAKARGWDICRGFCTFRTEIVSPVSLYLSRGGGGRSLPGTGPGGGKAANSRSCVSAALRGKDCVIYWKGVAKVQKNRMCRIGKV